MYYEVKASETMEYFIAVKADSEEEAIKKVKIGGHPDKRVSCGGLSGFKIDRITKRYGELR